MPFFSSLLKQLRNVSILILLLCLSSTELTKKHPQIVTSSGKEILSMPKGFTESVDLEPRRFYLGPASCRGLWQAFLIPWPISHTDTLNGFPFSNLKPQTYYFYSPEINTSFFLHSGHNPSALLMFLSISNHLCLLAPSPPSFLAQGTHSFSLKDEALHPDLFSQPCSHGSPGPLFFPFFMTPSPPLSPLGTSLSFSISKFPYPNSAASSQWHPLLLLLFQQISRPGHLHLHLLSLS